MSRVGIAEKLLAYLELKEKTKQKQLEILNLRQFYIDCAYLLWYQVAYFDVLKYLQAQLELQTEPFCLPDFIGSSFWIYGGINALPQDLYGTFEARARNVLNAYGKPFGAVCKVRVAKDAITVRWIKIKGGSGSAADRPEAVPRSGSAQGGMRA